MQTKDEILDFGLGWWKQPESATSPKNINYRWHGIKLAKNEPQKQESESQADLFFVRKQLGTAKIFPNEFSFSNYNHTFKLFVHLDFLRMVFQKTNSF